MATPRQIKGSSRNQPVDSASSTIPPKVVHRATAFLLFKRKTAYGEITVMPAMINPESIQEKVSASYSVGNVLGLSHQSLQYVFTESRTIPLELQISAGVLEQRGWIQMIPDLLQWKRFFQSLVIPSGPGLAPPTVRIIWPELKLAFEGVAKTVDVTYEQFAPTGRAIAYAISLEFLELGTRLMTSDRVLIEGIGRKAMGEG